MGLRVELASGYRIDEFGDSQLPPDAAVSPAVSLAARHLTGARPRFEFLPPKIRPWRQFTTRFSSKKLAWTGATAGSVALLVVGAFLAQQWQLSRLQSQWTAMEPKVKELESLQQKIRKFRPWFDGSFQSLSILRKLTEAFPEDGAVSAKTVEIRNLATVICSGTARNNQALLQMRDKLSAAEGVREVHIEQTRGSAPLQFTFNFHCGEGTGDAN